MLQFVLGSDSDNDYLHWALEDQIQRTAYWSNNKTIDADLKKKKHLFFYVNIDSELEVDVNLQDHIAYSKSIN